MIIASPAERRRADELATWLEAGRAPRGHDLEPVVELVTTLRPAPPTPSAEFRARLRANLVAQATRAVPAPRGPVEPISDRPPVRHRVRQTVAVAATVVLVAGAGTAAASTRALPGESLYGLKRGIESVQLSLARTDAAKGRELLEQAESRLTEAERLAAAEGSREPVTRARIDQALAEMDDNVRDGAEHLTESYRDTGDPEALVLLDQFAVEQRERLGDLMSVLGPMLQDDALDVLDLLNTLHTETVTLAGEQTAASAALPPAGDSQLGAMGGDGWAAGLLSETPSEATGPVDTGTATSTGTTASGESSTGGSPVSEVVGGVTGTLQGATGSTTTSSGSSEPAGSMPLPTGSPTSADNPEPSVSLPSSVEVSTDSSSPGGEDTGDGDVDVCVPVPPLTSC